MARKSADLAGPLKQVAALPVRKAEDGELEVLLVTSRETKRWVVPKGWPMKGKKDHEAAAQEAVEEAGVTGRVEKRPLATYQYWKRRDNHFDFCDVRVYLLQVEEHLKTWREKGQRERSWFHLEEAATLVDEPGLSHAILQLRRRKTRQDATAKG